MPSTFQYQPTFLQKLLGRNYKYWYLFLYRFKSRTVSVWDNMFFVTGHFLVLFGTLITWWLANDKIIDYGLEQKWTYFVIGEIFLALIYTFAEYLGFEYTKGSHVTDFLKPQNYIRMKLFDCYGKSSVQNIAKISILLIILIILAGLNIIRIDPSTILFYLAMAPIGLLILFFLGMIAASVGFFLPSIEGIILNYAFLSGLLMGRVFPLDLLIANFFVNLFNPFAFTFYHPMQIYLGKYNPIETLYGFLGGVIWCIILYFLAKLVFKLGLKKNEAVGL